MTEEKLYEFVSEKYLDTLNDLIMMNRKASFPDERRQLTIYESMIVKEVCNIILTNFSLTDKNARH